MIERLLRLFALAAVSVGLVACASTPQVNPSLAAAISARGVDQGTYLKICNGQALEYSDIQNLVQKGVPSQTIVSYLESTRKVYDFTYAQLSSLKAAGASPQVLNYLSETQGFYGNNTAQQKGRTLKEQKDRYYRTQYYQDEQPFAYNYPGVDDWYDSAYDESLSSPFSFNN